LIIFKILASGISDELTLMTSRTSSAETLAKTALAPQYLRKLRKKPNLNYFGRKNRGKRTVSKLLSQKNPDDACANTSDFDERSGFA